MPTSTITIQITGTPNVDDRLNLNYSDFLGSFTVYTVFKTTRTGAKQTTINSNINNQRVLLGQSLTVDYNQFGEYQIDLSGLDLIIIKRLDIAGYFDDAEIVGSWGNIVSIVNDVSDLPISATNLDYITHGSDNCNKVLLEITTNKQASAISIGGVSTNVVTNPFTVEAARGFSGTFTVYSSGESATFLYKTPNKFFITEIQQAYNPNGYIATVKVDDNSSFLDNITPLLTYSINGVNYQNSSSFSNLLPGVYTFYVRDPYGCTKSRVYEVIDNSQTFAVPDYFDFPEVNSIHFALQQPGARKNYKNTLSYEEKGYNQCDFKQIFLSTVNETLQFQTSRTDNVMVLIDKNGNEIPVVIDKKTNNINQFDSRDGQLYKFDDNFIGVYMNGGDVYDPTTVGITDTVIDDNLFFKTVPNWYSTGNFLTIGDLGTYQITGFLYVEEIGARVAKTSFREPNLATFEEIITINFNYQPYEVYEPFIDTSLLSGCYQLKLETTHEGVTDTWLSEVIEIVNEAPEKTHEFYYYNEDSNEVNYSTGIQHHLILPFIDNSGFDPSNENQVIRIDTTINNIEGQVTDQEIFYLNRIPGTMLRKIVRMCACDYVEINGASYSDLSFESEKIGNTNLYDITITAKPSEKQFVSNSGRRVVTNIESAGFILTSEGEGFIKHGN